MISCLIDRCVSCVQRKVYSTSRLLRWKNIYCQTKYPIPRVLPSGVIHRTLSLWGNSHKRLLFVGANRLNRLGIGGDHSHQPLDAEEARSKEEIKINSSEINSAWSIRLANENGYLSWCRNTYLATMVGIAMQAESPFLLSQQAADIAFVVAGFNLIWGTASFVSTIGLMRQQMLMSVPLALLQVVAAAFHLFLWVYVVLMYVVSDDVFEIPKYVDTSTDTSNKGV